MSALSEAPPTKAEADAYHAMLKARDRYDNFIQRMTLLNCRLKVRANTLACEYMDAQRKFYDISEQAISAYLPSGTSYPGAASPTPPTEPIPENGARPDEGPAPTNLPPVRRRSVLSIGGK